MSLGLKDVASKKRNAPAGGRRLELEAAVAAPTKERARPWSTSGLARQGLSRKEALGRDAHVSDEWAELHEAPLLWIDLTQGWAAAAHDRLSRAEERVRSLVDRSALLWRTAKWALSARKAR